jgi:translation initiation factor IF-2
MYRIAVTALAAVTFGFTAQAGDVFVTKDAQGNPVFTDRPESLPAQKVNVATQKKTDSVEAKAAAADSKAPVDSSGKAAEAAPPRETTQADKAKRCEEARTHYMSVMNSQRLYEQGPNEGERRYLDSAEIDATRENAKKVMDEFCAGQ